MKLFKSLSSEAQAGLREWAIWQHNDEALFDESDNDTPWAWAWTVFQLRVAKDLPEWFPKGKSATIQIIESWIYEQVNSARREA